MNRTKHYDVESVYCRIRFLSLLEQFAVAEQERFETSLDQGSKIHSLHDCCLALVLSAWQSVDHAVWPALRKIQREHANI
ncbi:hypothetical protein IC582_007027 [Cucumis melo]